MTLGGRSISFNQNVLGLLPNNIYIFAKDDDGRYYIVLYNASFDNKNLPKYYLDDIINCGDNTLYNLSKELIDISKRHYDSLSIYIDEHYEVWVRGFMVKDAKDRMEQTKCE